MAKEQDQSMEEILQSIKRIIAEEGEAPGGSDVLELTDLVQDDGAVTKAASAAEAPQVQTGSPIATPHIETMSIDDIISAPVLHEFEPTPPPPPKAAAPPPPQPKPPEPAMPAPTTDSLVSDQTLSASAAALSALRASPEPAPLVTTPSPVFRSGTTVEDLVLEVLRPMLKQWLDANLTAIVERLVEREIRKLTR